MSGAGQDGPPGGRPSVGPTPARVTSGDPIDVAWDALRGVFDPELGLDVVSLGLVYDVRGQDDVVVVEMTLTTPGCPASEALPDMAKMVVADALDGSAAVEVRVVWDPPWSPAMMDEDAASALGLRSG